jgi:hypothetical protein
MKQMKSEANGIPSAIKAIQDEITLFEGKRDSISRSADNYKKMKSMDF